MRLLFTFLCVLLLPVAGVLPGQLPDHQPKSPAEFLGYEPGDRFTRHHDIVAYMKHVADESPNVTWKQYGESYGLRPLFTVFVSSQDNLRALDTIRVNNRRMAGLDAGDIEGRTAAMLWMSYGIHGNEASSPEAAMQTLYELATGASVSHADITAWLENTVVVIDPVLNPDGRERYVSWFEQTQGRHPDARLETREHTEPWPGARTNHYYFDLNRDWAWQTQVESRQRIAFYNLWLPHVHADFHEMFTNDYYFPPAAEPFHATITPWQREFQEKIGRNHAARFDKRHERYFTREIFDLFYPGYGDTWPTFNGAVGMTYEQMGHSRAGLKMVDEHGDTLTLADRIRNHHEAGLSTVEVTAQNSERLRREFREYYRRAQEEPDGRYSAFVIGGDNHPDRIIALLDFLDRQEIRYEMAEGGRRFTGRHYFSGEKERRRIADNDIVVPVRQPKGVLAHVLFDPDPSVVLADSNTYDITAWALPYAFGLEAWAATERIRTTDEPVRTSTSYEPLGDEDYAWLLAWGDVRDAAFVAGLLNHNVRMSITERSFSTSGRTWPSGSVVITRRANRHLGDRLPVIIDNLAARHDRRVQAVSTGFTDSGVDLGSPNVHPLEKPVVAVPSGDGISAGNLGQIRHFFDYTLEYPLAVFDQRRVSGFPLDDYNVLILPDGSYTDWKDSEWDRIMEWVRDGGRLIAFPGVLRTLSAREEVNLSLRSFEPLEESDTDPDGGTKDAYNDPDATFPLVDIRFEDRRRQSLNRQISGAVFRVEMDDSHPLAFGLGPHYATLKRGTVLPDLLFDGWNVGRIAVEDPLLGGWAGIPAQQLAAGSLTAGTKSLGQGQIVILADNPLYRGFWRNGHLLFSNAIFQAWIAQ